MADVDEIYGGGNFLKSSDLPKGQIQDATIKSIDVQMVGDKQKLVLELDSGKAFVLNKTNAKQLADNFATPDYTKWVGKKFKLFRTTTQYQGGTVECLRVV